MTKFTATKGIVTKPTAPAPGLSKTHGIITVPRPKGTEKHTPDKSGAVAVPR